MSLVLQQMDLQALGFQFKTSPDLLDVLDDFDDKALLSAALVMGDDKLSPTREKLSFISAKQLDSIIDLVKSTDASRFRMQTPERFSPYYAESILACPTMLCSIDDLPADYSNWNAFQLTLNDRLSQLGSFRLFLCKPPIKSLMPGLTPSFPAKYVLTESVSDIDFTLFSETRTNAPLILQAPEVAAFWVWLKGRHQLEFLGATFNSLFLCASQGAVIDFKQLNKDLSSLRQSAPELVDRKFDMQPITLQWTF